MKWTKTKPTQAGIYAVRVHRFGKESLPYFYWPYPIKVWRRGRGFSCDELPATGKVIPLSRFHKSLEWRLRQND